MNNATRGASTIAAIIRSIRVKRGPLSIASRMKEGAIDTFAEHLARVFPNGTPTEAEIIRSLNLFAGQQPQVFLSQEEQVKLNRQRLSNEYGRKQVIPDITRKVLDSMTPRERLGIANGEPLPSRFVLKPYGDDNE